MYVSKLAGQMYISLMLGSVPFVNVTPKCMCMRTVRSLQTQHIQHALMPCTGYDHASLQCFFL